MTINKLLILNYKHKAYEWIAGQLERQLFAEAAAGARVCQRVASHVRAGDEVVAQVDLDERRRQWRGGQLSEVEVTNAIGLEVESGHVDGAQDAEAAAHARQLVGRQVERVDGGRGAQQMLDAAAESVAQTVAAHAQVDEFALADDAKRQRRRRRLVIIAEAAPIDAEHAQLAHQRAERAAAQGTRAQSLVVVEHEHLQVDEESRQ